MPARHVRLLASYLKECGASDVRIDPGNGGHPSLRFVWEGRPGRLVIACSSRDETDTFDISCRALCRLFGVRRVDGSVGRARGGRGG